MPGIDSKSGASASPAKPAAASSAKPSAAAAGTSAKTTILYALAGVAAVLSIVLGYYYPTLSTMYGRLFFNPSAWPHHASANLGKRCRFLDKSLFGCEDIVVHGEFAYLAFVLRLSFKENKLTKMHLSGFKPVAPGTLGLSLHGLSVTDGTKPNKLSLAAVNHRKGGSCVELFDHRVGTDELIHKETVCDPLIYNPNDVALVSPRSFYVTNMVTKDSTPNDVKKQLLLAQPTGTLVFRDGTAGQVRKVRDGLHAANGVSVAPNGRQLLVSETSSHELSIWDIQADYSVRSAEPKLPLGFAPDNIATIPETGNWVVSGPAASWPFAKAEGADFAYQVVEPGKRGSPPRKQKPKFDEQEEGESGSGRRWTGHSSVIALVHNATASKDKFYGHKYKVTPIVVDPEGTFIYGASIAAVNWETKQALVGGPLMKGVVMCEWPETVPADEAGKGKGKGK
ncbi:hypothetical protein BCR44DRAFT_1432324 [Catenaria anguillulae PL171]|uniref:Uncharacterized protein n=1 Tax=Catenaria anguillulae PL171 TaxID=765915 RepID=A0A1Y2HPV9_9FUNG|nr:hypothetical protein BCR44DRAFT_1432324 [Catenaria anguillulae PL171]